jgi:hypothetical protein
MVYVEYGMRPNYNYSRIIYEVSFGLSDKSMRWPRFFFCLTIQTVLYI